MGRHHSILAPRTGSGDDGLMAAEAHLQDITHTIQLAVAPVFLLTALGTTLSVLVTRLGRVVDRARRVEGRLTGAGPVEAHAIQLELQVLVKRTRLIHGALTFGTSAALLVCLLIAVAFVGYMLDAHLGTVMALLFVAAMAAYVGALLSFLREVFIATKNLRFGLSEADAEAAARTALVVQGQASATPDGGRPPPAAG